MRADDAARCSYRMGPAVRARQTPAIQDVADQVNATLDRVNQHTAHIVTVATRSASEPVGASARLDAINAERTDDTNPIGDRRPRGHVALASFRMAQQALTNAERRHSGGRCGDTIDRTHISLAREADGDGTDRPFVRQGQRDSGPSLCSMHQRVHVVRPQLNNVRLTPVTRVAVRWTTRR